MPQIEIETLFNKLDTSVKLIQSELDVSYLEALLETGENILDGRVARQVDGLPTQTVIEKLTNLYQTLPIESMEPEEIRKAFQLALLK
ncbi:MAG: hypothetical protein NDN66_12020 [Carnobacterium sp.]|uniref:hypothetical protein n=1 Tax=Carnobacterium sp. TaxID=48221 RepID=UPI002958C791|nr:hypothetical protein [Carnobacterium sp.]MDV8935244.1 hypothetical protein [Carnobacterium sp.]